MMHFEFHISKQDLMLLHQHAETSLPSEAVALLFGTTTNNVVKVNRVELMENDSESQKTSFSVNPETQYQLLIEAEELDETLVGIYHSHPAPPRPSTTDLKNMHLNPVIWLISSKMTGEWVSKAYILDEKTVSEVPINHVDSTASGS